MGTMRHDEAQHTHMLQLVSGWLDSRAISHMQDMTADVFNNRRWL